MFRRLFKEGSEHAFNSVRVFVPTSIRHKKTASTMGRGYKPTCCLEGYLVMVLSSILPLHTERSNRKRAEDSCVLLSVVVLMMQVPAFVVVGGRCADHISGRKTVPHKTKNTHNICVSKKLKYFLKMSDLCKKVAKVGLLYFSHSQGKQKTS